MINQHDRFAIIADGETGPWRSSRRSYRGTGAVKEVQHIGTGQVDGDVLDLRGWAKNKPINFFGFLIPKKYLNSRGSSLSFGHSLIRMVVYRTEREG